MSELVDLSEPLVRLDALLAEAGEEAMVLTELDGFLCGLAVSPTAVDRSEWWPFEWLADERGVVKPGHEELERLILARQAEIETELASDSYAPLYEVDDDSGEIVWEAWIAGFQQAMFLRFDEWDALLRDTGDSDRGEAAMGLATGLMLAQSENMPDDTAGEEEWAEYDEMVEAMPEILAHVAVELYRLHKVN
jgi:uncharacterized protein